MFWYVDALAARAALNHSAFCRQALVGGFYELLGRESFEPNPDFYAALLFKQLMGPTVLRARVVGNATRMLRVWAQCQSPGLVTLLLLNLANDTDYQVPVDSLGVPGLAGAKRYDYELTAASTDNAGGLTSRRIALNGALLQPGPAGQIPSLSAHALDQTGNPLIVVRRHSVRFVTLEDTAAEACYPQR